MNLGSIDPVNWWMLAMILWQLISIKDAIKDLKK